MRYTDQDLRNLISEVEKQFTAHLSGLSSDTTLLAKAEDAEEKKEEAKEEKAEDKAEVKEEAKEEKKEEAQEEAQEAAPEAKEEVKEESKEEQTEEADADDVCDYDEEDLEHLHKMYSSMKKAELKIHHDAVRSALDSYGMEKCGEIEMAKSENDVVVEIKEDTKSAEEIELLKSEVEAQKSKAETLQKNLDAVKEFLTKYVEKTAPKGKAITSLDVIAKSEIVEEKKEWTKQEIDSVLSKKVASPTLTKSDRDLINEYYLNGKNVNIISHLLK
jgi:hypothetical protein